MSDTSSLVWAAIIGALASVLVQIISAYGLKGKTHAEANAITSSEWRELYREMSDRLDKVEHELDIAKDYIQYLWAGTISLTDQIKAEGKEPVFKPKRNFRGNDDFDVEEWTWLEGAK